SKGSARQRPAHKGRHLAGPGHRSSTRGDARRGATCGHGARPPARCCPRATTPTAGVKRNPASCAGAATATVVQRGQEGLGQSFCLSRLEDKLCFVPGVQD
ncbi:hypothetical protein BHM03_00036728, partial [Ensete ventricosum]